MLWIKSLNCHKIGFYISSLVFVLGLFFSVFFATDTFASTASCIANIDGSHSFSNYSPFYDFSSDVNCDLSSLNTSNTLYFKYSFNFVSGSNGVNSAGQLCFSARSDCSGSGLPYYYSLYVHSLGYTFFNNNSFDIVFDNSLLSSYPLAFKVFIGSRNSIDLSGGSTLSLLVSDSSYSDLFVSNPVSGTLNISQNGTYDVSSYASAEVDVPPVMGDYHDDLQQGITAIYVLGGVMLVIYFFYCIYRMIIKNVGGD